MKKLIFPSLLVLLMSISAAVHADIGKKQAVSIAQSVFPGRVLAVKQEQENNTSVYRVKTLSAGGDVHIIVIDADSGKVISKQ
jgi:uncharacterized membrane protein YkoI